MTLYHISLAVLYRPAPRSDEREFRRSYIYDSEGKTVVSFDEHNSLYVEPKGTVRYLDDYISGKLEEHARSKIKSDEHREVTGDAARKLTGIMEKLHHRTGRVHEYLEQKLKEACAESGITTS